MALACTLWACACRTAPPASSADALGELDSDRIKISWFFFRPEKVVKGAEGRLEVSWSPQYFVVFSHGWLRAYGPRPKEAHLAKVPNVRVSFSESGVEDALARSLVSELIQDYGLRDLPAAAPGMVTAEWMAGIQRLPMTDDTWKSDWQFARIVTVETDRTKRMVVPYFFRGDPGLLQKYGKLEGGVSRIMQAYAPRAGK